MPLRVFVCPPAALEAGQTFSDLLLLAVAESMRRIPAPASSSPDNLSVCVCADCVSVGVLFELDLVI